MKTPNNAENTLSCYVDKQQPMIYVVCEDTWNEGMIHHGCWIDVVDDVEQMERQIEKLLDHSPAVNVQRIYAVLNCDGFDGYELDRSDSLFDIQEKALFICQNPKIGAKILGQCEGLLEDAQKVMDEQYEGCYSSLGEYARVILEEELFMPKCLRLFVNYEKVGQRMERQDEMYCIKTDDNQVHVFCL